MVKISQMITQGTSTLCDLFENIGVMSSFQIHLAILLSKVSLKCSYLPKYLFNSYC